MIPVAVIVGATLIVGIGVAVKFWNKIISFLQRLVEKLKNVVQGVLMGVKVFLRKTKDGIQYVTKTYAQDKETKKWEEGLVKKDIEVKEIPKEEKQKLDQMEMDEDFDISEKLELKMKR